MSGKKTGSEDFSQQPLDEDAEEAFQEELATPAVIDANHNDQEYDAEELRDLELAIGLLSGVWTQTGVFRGGPDKRYMQGALDKQARLAIGRLLRNRKPLDSALRYQLAELFDGLPPYSSFDAAPMVRTIAFAFGRAGIPKAGTPKEKQLRNLHLASDYRTLIEAGTPRKVAVGELCKKYGVSDTVVKEACRANRSLAPRAVKRRIGRPGQFAVLKKSALLVLPFSTNWRR